MPSVKSWTHSCHRRYKTGSSIPLLFNNRFLKIALRRDSLLEGHVIFYFILFLFLKNFNFLFGIH